MASDYISQNRLAVSRTSEVSQKFYARFWQFNISINQSNHIHKIRISKSEIRNKSEIQMLKCSKQQPKPDDTEALHPILIRQIY